MINVAELIDDPDFAQPNGITVIREKWSIENHQSVIAETQFNVPGIITVENFKELDVRPEFERNTEAINIYTQEKLYTTGDYPGDGEFVSDKILWHGEPYRIYSVQEDSDYGFFRAIAARESMR